MSDQFTMQRADLAKKDKSELQTIIAALGGTSSARSKKDTLIDQVLELSGVTAPAPAPTASSESNTGEADAASPQSAPDQAASQQRAAEEPSSGAAPANDSRQQRQAQPRSGANQRSNRQADQGTPSRSDKPSAESDSSDNKGRGQTSQDKGGQEKSKQGSSDESSSSQSNAQSDDTDEGNRKRRRRGRGRDNVAEDSQTSDLVPVSGFLDLHDSGYGFLRVDGHRQSASDVYVAVKMARTLALRRGDLITGSSRPAQRNEKNPALQQVESVSSLSVDEAKDRPVFEDLTPVHPVENLIMERADAPNLTGRVLDLVTPLAMGQRGLIVAPPRTGKTETLAEMALSLAANHSDVSLFIVQLDERPEEVTKMRRAVPSAQVVASQYGRPADEHVSAVELTLERAKRLAETGHNVVILLDGLSRLIRAYNMASQGGNRVGLNSVDASALYAAKRCFGTACNLEEGGSITIFATINDAASGPLDELIFDEFVDAANVEIYLDRGLAEVGVFPSIDVGRSATRDEHLLMDERSAELVAKARRSVVEPRTDDAGAPLVRLLSALTATPSTEDFLNEFA